MEKLKYSVNDFFELFFSELESSPSLHNYYKFHVKDKNFEFRKAYFIQRLEYIVNNLNRSQKIWDCGCGYGTTAIFLTLNGFNVVGTTLEFYYNEIEKRKVFWSKYGNIDNLEINYENLFDRKDTNEHFNVIIAQDTLHHLEPFDEAINILHDSLSANGYIIAIEENGNNIIQNLKLYKQRGNKRIINIYDEKLKKNILIGNENIRGLKRWKQIFNKNNFIIDDEKTEFIRLFPSFYFKRNDIGKVIKKEKALSLKTPLLKKYFFFGINFIAYKK